MNRFDPNDLETSEYIIVQHSHNRWFIAQYHRSTDTFHVCSAPVDSLSDAKMKLREYDPEVLCIG
jgi:hypothetical protein